MRPELTESWLLFTFCFSLLLVVSFVMFRQSLSFYTKDVIVRKFSIMELEIPATPRELVNVIGGMYQLPPEQSAKSINALKSQLRLDFLFMPLVYGCIFLLCWRVAHKTQLQAIYYVFAGLALLQVVPWICDIIENIYLLQKIRKDVQASAKATHKLYLLMEAAKWGISLTATVAAASAICYLWLTGRYTNTSLWYLLVVVVEISLFAFALMAYSKKAPLS